MATGRRDVVECAAHVVDAPAFHIMTPAEAWERFDLASRRYLQMSGEEFVRAWEAGAFDGDADRPEVMRVAMLRPGGR